MNNRLSLLGAMALSVCLATSAFAAPQGGFSESPTPPANQQPGTPGGGFNGPGPSITTVQQAKDLSDDTPVSLRGRIVQSLGGENYVFEDSTGSITVEIDNKRWQGQQVTPQDTVEIQGEVDKGWTSLTIDVDRIVKH